jgi:hypothetical protein
MLSVDLRRTNPAIPAMTEPNNQTAPGTGTCETVMVLPLMLKSMFAELKVTM